MKLKHLPKIIVDYLRTRAWPDKESVKEFFKHYFGGIYNRADEHHIFLYASGLAFSLFLCIIPFVLIIFAALGSILEVTSIENQIYTFIYTVIPYQSYADYAYEIVSLRIKEFVDYKNVAGVLGGFGLLFAASGLFSAMRTILNHIFSSYKDKNVVIGKLRDFAMVILVLIFIFTATFLLPAIDILRNFTFKSELFKYFRLTAFEHFTITFISFAIIFLIFFALYSFVPYAKLGKRVPALSALWAALLWEIAKRLFEYYINNVATLNRVYGTYALIVVVAFWIYYSSVLFILGAEIGQLYRERLILKGKVDVA